MQDDNRKLRNVTVGHKMTQMENKYFLLSVTHLKVLQNMNRINKRHEASKWLMSGHVCGHNADYISSAADICKSMSCQNL